MSNSRGDHDETATSIDSPIPARPGSGSPLSGKRTCGNSGCCSTGKKDVAETSCTASCHTANDELDFADPLDSTSTPDADIEKGPATWEHVKLSVSGMTCSGCETKLQKALHKIPSIQKIKTDLVLAQAQFSIDTRLISVDDVLLRLKHTTPYSFEIITHNDGQYLDIVVDNPETFCGLAPPFGVLGIEQLGRRVPGGKSIVRISYDPTKVYPRDLLEKGFGLRNIQLAPIAPPSSVIAGRKQMRKELAYLVASTICTIPVLVFAWAPIHGPRLVYNGVSLVLATIIQVGVAWEFYPNAFRSLVHSKVADMDLLVVLSTSAAYIVSVVAFSYYATGRAISLGSFFETSTLLVTLIRLGRFVSELARQKATESVSVRSLQAPTALLPSKNRTTTREIDVRLLQHGDVFRVLPHARVPTDGVVVYGGSQVDESMMTGESKPVAKGIDSRVTAGTMNLDGSLDVVVRRMPFENSISEIGDMVENAELTKPRSQAIADRVAGYFVPSIIVVACAVFVAWTILCSYVYRWSKSSSAVQATKYAIATLIVSCPCAIGLAVPMVIVIAGGVAAKHGVIFRSPSAIETARSVSHIVFDKTGTLTEGKMTVIYEDCDYDEIPHILGLVSGNKHPMSVAVLKYLTDRGFYKRTEFSTTTVIVGSGIEGRLGELVVRGGNCRWLGIQPSPKVRNFLQRLRNDTFHNLTEHDEPRLDFSVFGVTVNGKLSALYALEDTLRPEAAHVISTLRAWKINISIVSGDDERAVQRVAQLLNIPLSNTRSRCSPRAKQEYVQALQQGSRAPTIMFCGDGTNDAVALTQANIGMHISGGTDVAKSCADVVLMRADLRGLLVARALSRRAARRIWFNFAWAAAYNTVAVLLAAGAFVKVHGALIPPQFAGLGEIASVLPVVLIAFSLKFSRFEGLVKEEGRRGVLVSSRERERERERERARD